MKILKVIHGYPMRYNAGSEVYSQTLCHGLAERHEVHVFTREEDAFAPDFRLRRERDPDDPRVTIHLVNNPRFRDRYRAVEIDQRFAEVLDRIGPDLVHVGHLNHLSTSLLQEAARREIPIVFTLHVNQRRNLNRCQRPILNSFRGGESGAVCSGRSRSLSR